MRLPYSIQRLCATRASLSGSTDLLTPDFPLENGDLVAIGSRLQALGDGVNKTEVKQLFRREGF
jgi:hypothetical protein